MRLLEGAGEFASACAWARTSVNACVSERDIEVDRRTDRQKAGGRQRVRMSDRECLHG